MERLVYLASTGRSGTTLLDTLLGLHPRLWTLGEPEMLAWTRERPDLPCGCGTSIIRCDFWDSVLDGVCHSEIRQLGYFRGPTGTGKVIRSRILRRELLGQRNSSNEVTPKDIYGAVTLKLLRRVRNIVRSRKGQPVEWIVDSSKHPYRLMWLLSEERIDIRVVHLVRDPRAFAFSVTGHGDGSMLEGLRAGANWTAQNAIHHYLATSKLRDDQVLRLKYEDMARRPSVVLRRVFRWLGVEQKDVASRFRQETTHAAVGNPMRWEETDIELDRRWIDGSSLGVKLASYLGAWPLARAYGYKALR